MIEVTQNGIAKQYGIDDRQVFVPSIYGHVCCLRLEVDCRDGMRRLIDRIKDFVQELYFSSPRFIYETKCLGVGPISFWLSFGLGPKVGGLFQVAL